MFGMDGARGLKLHHVNMENDIYAPWVRVGPVKDTAQIWSVLRAYTSSHPDARDPPSSRNNNLCLFRVYVRPSIRDR